MCAVEGLEHCAGPIDVVQVSGAKVSPNPDSARVVQIILKSTYPLNVELRLDNAPIVYEGM
jgi:hypothetical protein